MLFSQLYNGKTGTSEESPDRCGWVGKTDQKWEGGEVRETTGAFTVIEARLD